MKRIILDTETTGLDFGSRVIQLAYIALDENNEYQYCRNYFFAVDHVPDEVAQVHGFDTEYLKGLAKGKTFRDYWREVKAELDWGWFIAHNAEFDYKHLQHEFYREGSFFIPARIFCTMRFMTNKMRLPPKPGHVTYKWPNNSEMGKFLSIDTHDAVEFCAKEFGASGIGVHDARYDVAQLYLCYKRMIKEYGK